jgi:hypothetical protein
MQAEKKNPPAGKQKGKTGRGEHEGNSLVCDLRTGLSPLSRVWQEKVCFSKTSIRKMEYEIQHRSADAP